jgi:hypothetical protein
VRRKLAKAKRDAFALTPRLSSSAKAEDPVIADAWIKTNACDYWVPAFAGMTPE